MSHYLIRPEVPGSWRSIGDLVPVVYGEELLLRPERFEFVFEGYLGDDIVTSSPIFLVTTALASALQGGGLEIPNFSRIDIFFSEQFQIFADDYPSVPPEWWFLDAPPLYSDTTADFAIDASCDLICTERAFEVLRSFNLSHCEYHYGSPNRYKRPEHS
jgi:hypothetical protein